MDKAKEYRRLANRLARETGLKRSGDSGTGPLIHVWALFASHCRWLPGAPMPPPQRPPDASDARVLLDGKVMTEMSGSVVSMARQPQGRYGRDHGPVIGECSFSLYHLDRLLAIEGANDPSTIAANRKYTPIDAISAPPMNARITAAIPAHFPNVYAPRRAGTVLPKAKLKSNGSRRAASAGSIVSTTSHSPLVISVSGLTPAAIHNPPKNPNPTTISCRKTSCFINNTRRHWRR